MSKRLVDSASSCLLEMNRAEREMKFFRRVHSLERSNVVVDDGIKDAYFEVLMK